MQNLYEQTNDLDARAVKTFHLSEELMMEHAAIALRDVVQSQCQLHDRILIVCGSGNNGADGLALARLLLGNYRVEVHLPFGARSTLCQVQHDRLQALGLFPTALEMGPYALIVDALFGSGLSRPLDPHAITILDHLNALEGFKLACDLPSGLYRTGMFHPSIFRADHTLTMGGIKRHMLGDPIKPYIGTLSVATLGIDARAYERPSPWQLLEAHDLRLPLRDPLSPTHKGSYGHSLILAGDQMGAAVLAGLAALRLGSGLVSVLHDHPHYSLPSELMHATTRPSSTSAIAIGMGLGNAIDQERLHTMITPECALLLDADALAHPLLLEWLEYPHVVITPHPKEFVRVLQLTQIADIDVATLQKDRFDYVERFNARYPHITLVLKGANVIIAHHTHRWINPLGSALLAKGGSGDVLSGFIVALLAQGYPPHEAAIHASLAHTLSARALTQHNYALNPHDLIHQVGAL